MTNYHDEEKNLLKITINHIAKENEEFNQQIDDMKITLQSNREILKEYLSQISNKDSTVQKLNNTIEQLRTRLQNFQSPSKGPGHSINDNTALTARVNRNHNLHDTDMQYKGIGSNLTSRKKASVPLINNNNIEIGMGNSIIGIGGGNSNNEDEYNSYCDKQKKVIAELDELKASLLALINQREDNKEEEEKVIGNSDNTNTNINTKVEIGKGNSISKVNDISQLLQYLQDDGSHIVLFVDDNKQIWELVPMPGLTEQALNEMKTIPEEKYIEEDDDDIVVYDNDNQNQMSTNDKKILDNYDDVSLKDLDVNISKGSAFSYNSNCLESLK